MVYVMVDYFKWLCEFFVEVMEKLEFMCCCQMMFDKDINDFVNDVMIISLLCGRFGQVVEILGCVGFVLMIKVQFYVVDVLIWVVGYCDGLCKFDGDEGKVILFVDCMVVWVQDSGVMFDWLVILCGMFSENVWQVEWVWLFIMF